MKPSKLTRIVPSEQTNLALVETEETVRCPRCERPDLLVKDFGICRARATGRNLYCMRCVREKIAAGRQALREYKAAHPRLAQQSKWLDLNFSPRRIARMLRKLSPAERVKEAIRCGAETQVEIARVTKLSKDEVGEAIAQMLLYEYTIRTEVIDGVRRYFVNESGQARMQRRPVRPREPRSHGVSTIYFEGEAAVWKVS